MGLPHLDTVKQIVQHLSKPSPPTSYACLYILRGIFTPDHHGRANCFSGSITLQTLLDKCLEPLQGKRVRANIGSYYNPLPSPTYLHKYNLQSLSHFIMADAQLLLAPFPQKPIPNQLQGLIALVTGAAGNIGHETAQ